MNLLVVFIASVMVGQAIAVASGLIVERVYSPYAGLVVFIALYFIMFWAAWRVSVRLTAPKANA
jgi:Na+-translocating ferredoxin:NAD+ oxidoreductase RnfC subunit